MTAAPACAAVEYRLLGPMQVLRAGTPVLLGPPKARALLGYLLLHANAVVSVDRLVDVLWGERPPATAAHALQVYVAGLRRVLEPDRRRGATPEVLRTRRPGYELAVGSEQLDLDRFERIVQEGRDHAAAGRSEEAASLLRAAEALWSGPALADLASEGFAASAVRRLEELRVGAIEDRVEAELAVGHHGRLAGELAGLVAEYPTRERLHGQLMVTLYRCGRQTEALLAFRALRGRLDEEGLLPTPWLRQLELSLLRQDPALAAPDRTGGPPEPTAVVARSAHADRPPALGRGQLLARKVTVVHSAASHPDDTDEDLAAALEDVPYRLTTCLEALGGTVVERVGGAVTAVFGIPSPHEDDPERAVRAGLDVVLQLGRYGRQISETWNVAPPVVRVGVCTGWSSPDRTTGLASIDAVGDGPSPAAVLLASRAPAGTVLVDGPTRTLVDGLFRWADGGVGDASAVTVAVAPAGRIGRLPDAVAFVGRSDELAAGRVVIDGALAGTGGLLWITGDVGVGKTRLLAELRAHAGRAARPVGWIEGHCLSYGEGLAHWPIRDLLHTWLGIPMQAPELLLRARLRHRIEALFGVGGTEVHVGLAALLDLRPDRERTDRAPRLSPEAMERVGAAAVRDLLVRLAADGPLVIAVEDVHWADAGSLRLLETVLECTQFSGIAVVITQRPEREHPSWQLRELAQRRLAHRTTEITLGPLPAGADADLLTALAGPDPVDPGLGRRLLATAEGNPFFLEELVRSLPDRSGRPGGATSVDIPATVEQVLGSRIGRLPATAQQLLVTAAVLGRRFSLDTLVEVAGLDTVPTEALGELAAHGLVVQTQGWPTAEFEFRHVLTHEAAYRSLWPPRRRELHRRTAEALQAKASTHPGARDEALARHWQLAGDDEQAIASHWRAARAAFTVHVLDVAEHHFAEGLAAGRRLGRRADPLVVNDLLLGLGQVGRLTGRGDPEARLAEALDGAVAAADLATEWRARHELGIWLGYGRGRPREARSCFEAAASAAERLGKIGDQVSALSRVSILLANELDFVAALQQSDRALRLATEADDERAFADALDARKLYCLFLGEVGEFENLLPRLQTILRRHDDLWTLQFVLAEAAVVAAATGRWADAEARLRAADEINVRCGDRLCRPFLIATRAGIERSRGVYGDALRTGAQAVAAAQDGAWWGPWARTDYGATLLELYDVPAAISQLQTAASTAMMQAQQVRSLAQLAWARWQAGEHARAAQDLHAAEAMLATMSAPVGRTYLFGADAALACGQVRLGRGEPDLAIKLAGPVVSAAEHSGWLEPLARGLLLVGRCRWAAGERDRALRCVGRALELSEGAGLPGIAWQARAVLAGLGAADAAGLLRRARRDVVELSTTVSDARLRAGFLDAAFVEVDRLAAAPFRP